jgi:hypothetical protein
MCLSVTRGAMEAIGLFFTKFSDELLSAQIALLSFSLALAVYWMLVRKKKRETAEWVPAALVRAYLDRVRADERDTRIKLFGEDSGYAVSPQMPLTQMLGSPTVTQTVISNDPALQKEIEALRGQLAMADTRAMEFDRTLNGLRAEKAAIEQKLKEAPAAGAGAAPGAADPAMLRELEDLRARIQEYDVVSEEIANIKILQKENEKLKQRVSQLEGGAPALTVVPGGAAAPQPVTTIPATPKAEAPAPAPAPKAEPAATAAAPAPEANTNVLAPVTPSVDAAPEKTSKQKEEELLSEFEKMLAS